MWRTENEVAGFEGYEDPAAPGGRPYLI